MRIPTLLLGAAALTSFAAAQATDCSCKAQKKAAPVAVRVAGELQGATCVAQTTVARASCTAAIAAPVAVSAQGECQASAKPKAAPVVSVQGECTASAKSAPVAVLVTAVPQGECQAHAQAAPVASVSLQGECQAPAKAAPVASVQGECEAQPKASPVAVRLLTPGAPSAELQRIFAVEASPIEAGDAGALLVLDSLDSLVPDDERGYLGVVMDVTDEGMVLEQVMPGSPAAKAGLKPGDRITRIGDHKVKDQESLTAYLQKRKAGKKVELRIVRDGWVKEVEVKLAPLSAIQGLEGQPGLERVEERPVEAIEEVVETPYVLLQPATGDAAEWAEKKRITEEKKKAAKEKEKAAKQKATKQKAEKQKAEKQKAKAGGVVLGDGEWIQRREGVDLNKGGVLEFGLEGGEGVHVFGLEGGEGMNVFEVEIDDGDFEDLKERIRVQVQKELKGSLGEDVEVHVEAGGLHGLHGLLSREKGDAKTFDSRSDDGKEVRRKVIVKRGGEGGTEDVEVYELDAGGKGHDVYTFKTDGEAPKVRRRIGIGGAGAPSSDFFLRSGDDDDDDDHAGRHDDDDGHDHDGDQHEHEHEHEVHTRQGMGGGVMLDDVTNGRRGNVLFMGGGPSGGGSGLEDLRNELRLLREELTRLRDDLRALHRGLGSAR